MSYDAAAVGKRLRALRQAGGWTLRELKERATKSGRDISHTTISAVEKGKRKRPSADTLETLSFVLGWPSYETMLASEAIEPPRPPNGALPPIDTTESGVSSLGIAALSTEGGGGGGSPAPGLHDAHTYAGFMLWGRDDPRDPSAERVALSPGRAVVSLCKGLGPPQRIKAVRVGDAGALEITTSAGPVARDWCLFIDITKADDAKPGTNVAAMSRRGELIVGELAQEADDAWVVVIGPDTQEAIDRSKVVGIIVGYQPPRLDVGRVVRHRSPGVVIPPPDEPVVPDAGSA